MYVERTLALKIPYFAIFKLIVMLDFNTFNLPKFNISCKKTFKCRTEIVLFGY